MSAPARRRKVSIWELIGLLFGPTFLRLLRGAALRELDRAEVRVPMRRGVGLAQ